MKILEAQLYSMNDQSVILSRPIENPRPDDGERAVAASATRSLDSAELSRAKESATCAVERSLFSARSARFKRFLLFSPLRQRRKPRAQPSSRLNFGTPRFPADRIVVDAYSAGSNG